MRLIDAYLLGEFTKTINGRAYVPYDVIMSMTPIDAEPVRHGHWTRDYESSWGDSRFMCSVCHCKESVPTCNGEPSIWDYCPNCGAKMDMEEE